MQGFGEVGISVTPDWTQFLANNKQDRRKKYGLKHHLLSTIHSAMRDTLQITAAGISRSHGN